MSLIWPENFYWFNFLNSEFPAGLTLFLDPDKNIFKRMTNGAEIKTKQKQINHK